MSALTRLPAFARGIALSGYGRYLNWWRYGPDTEKMVEEALDREKWDQTRWQSWVEDRTARILFVAARQVPFYRHHWAGRRSKGDRASPELLQNWPRVVKEDVRRNPRAFLVEGKKPLFLYRESTSGTTGTPLTLWWGRPTLKKWYALFEARWRRWYGLSRTDAWANIGGRLIVDNDRSRPPYWVWNSTMRQLYMSSYHISEGTIDSYFRAIEERNVRYLYGYSSSIYSLALAGRNAGAKPPAMTCALTNAEPLYEYQRETIEAVLGCRVIPTYGMTEMVAAASQCEHGRMHTWPEVGLTESIPDGQGRLRTLCTGLLGEETILIRYQVGDELNMGPPSEGCLCGRNLPILTSIEGRSDDMLRTRDGRWIGRLDPVFKGDLPICEAQIIQESLERVSVLVVPDRTFGDLHREELRQRIRERMGDVVVDIERVDAIPRGPNGKFRAVVNRMGHDGH